VNYDQILLSYLARHKIEKSVGILECPLPTMSESEMGNKVTKTTAAEPSRMTFILPSTMNTVYTMRFTGIVVRWKEEKEVRSKHVRHARYDLEESHNWGEWLRWTMRDAVVNEFEKATGQEIHPKSQPPVTDFVLKLDPRMKRDKLGGDSHTRISGVITWRSVATEPSALKAAVQWRLGDRMAFYGLQDDIEKWSYIFTPGEVLVEPYDERASSGSE
jgi:hypothetical protein